MVKKSILYYEELSINLKKLENTTNKKFKEIFTALNYLITEKQEAVTLKNRKRIGFKPVKI